MKKIIFYLFFIFSIFSYGKDKIMVIDEDFVINNYKKSKSYNAILLYKKNYLEKTYNIDFSQNEKVLKENEKYQEFQKIRNDYIKEVNQDVDLGMFLVSEGELLINKKVILFGETNDLTEKVLSFLNELYSSKKEIEKNKKTLDILNIIV